MRAEDRSRLRRRRRPNSLAISRISLDRSIAVMPATVDILMATYNGAVFLEEQLNSIIHQSYDSWHLYIRDDGSTDGTIDIIRGFISKYPEKIVLVDEGGPSLGAAGNFSALMAHSTAPYIKFSDQDDIWEIDKVELFLQKMQAVERENVNMPIYLFSDLSMIDADGQPISASLWARDGLQPNRTCLNQLLVQNIPYGCATMINRPLLDLVYPVDVRALLHDHWMVLLAAANGMITTIPKATIHHRIHTSNASRSNNPIRKEREPGAAAILRNKNFDNYVGKLQDQAQAVKERLLERNINKAPYDVLDDFINLQSRSLLARKYLMIKRGFFKHSKLQSLKWLLRI